MPRVDIWIRKENEDTWNSIGDKSRWVNDRLSRQTELKKEITKPLVFEPKFAQEYPPEPIMKIAEIKPDWKSCKHGADPEFCKFSKPGKPCK